MFVFSHTLVHPGILQGKVANFKPDSVHLHPVLDVSENPESDGEIERVCFCSRKLMLFFQAQTCLKCCLSVYDCEETVKTRHNNQFQALALAFVCQVDLWQLVL